ncbi:MAG: fumarylacetoacetate hydrolase family protein, partial [Desulfocucumaceae bacterium]
EAELAVVMAARCKNVAAGDAPGYILGFTCANDVTARDLQARDGQWTRAKSFDTFLPLGPYIITDINPGQLDISLYLNGQLKQKSNTSNLIFTVSHLVSFISRIMTLNPGDVILTGTPSGVGPMQRGDRVEVVIESLGSLSNTVR